MTAETTHTCSYSCERPGCIRAQRDYLAARLTAPQSAPVGVDFAAVASILRRAMRDGTHYGYRRDFILQQALALEALSQQPAAVDEAAAIRAFEEHFEASAEDPYFEGELKLWLTAWRKALAAQQQEASHDHA